MPELTDEAKARLKGEAGWHTFKVAAPPRSAPREVHTCVRCGLRTTEPVIRLAWDARPRCFVCDELGWAQEQAKGRALLARQEDAYIAGRTRYREEDSAPEPPERPDFSEPYRGNEVSGRGATVWGAWGRR